MSPQEIIFNKLLGFGLTPEQACFIMIEMSNDSPIARDGTFLLCRADRYKPHSTHTIIGLIESTGYFYTYWVITDAH